MTAIYTQITKFRLMHTYLLPETLTGGAFAQNQQTTGPFQQNCGLLTNLWLFKRKSRRFVNNMWLFKENSGLFWTLL